jgi:hypothetical protein
MIGKSIMPRNSVTKDELNVRVLNLKNELYNGLNYGKSGDWHDGAHDALNRVLDILKEYRE